MTPIDLIIWTGAISTAILFLAIAAIMVGLAVMIWEMIRY